MKDIKILIVDDSPFQIALLSDTLVENGFNVVGDAQSLKEVIEKTNELKPDLVTMDMTLPGTDGFECTKAIHDIDSNIKVIIVSSMMDDELIKKAKNNNISGYIQKPVDSEELSLLINRVVADEDLYLELDKIYVEVFKEAMLNIFNRLTKTIPEFKNECNIDKGREIEGISIIMGIIGKYSGRVIFDMSFKTAENFVKELLRRDPKDEEEILNVISEVVNMFAGNACSIINKRNKIFGLRVAPPTTLHGESINISKAKLESNYSADIETKFGEFSINIGFKRGESTWMSNI